MAEITAANVGKLREMTGAGMMDCKKALVEANGDIEAAVDISAQKRHRVRREKGRAARRTKASSPNTSRPARKSACWWKSIAKRISSPRTTASARSATTSPRNLRRIQTRISKPTASPSWRRLARTSRFRGISAWKFPATAWSPLTSTPARKSACSSKSARASRRRRARKNSSSS